MSGVFCFNDAEPKAEAEADTEAVANEDAVRFEGLGGGIGNGG